MFIPALFTKNHAIFNGLQILTILCLLVGLSLPSLACRLLLVVQQEPDVTDVQERFIGSSRSLRNQAQAQEPWYQVAGQSIKNNFYGASAQNYDGFGLLAFSQRPTDAVVYKRNADWIQLSESTKQLTDILIRTAPITHTYLGHIRAASPNTSLNENNNHPFKIVRHGEETWYFMANGGIHIPNKTYTQKIKKYPWLTTYASKAPLPSDSEYLFHWLMADVENALGGKYPRITASNTALVQKSLSQSFAKLLTQQPLVAYQPSTIPSAIVPVNVRSSQPLVRTIGKTWILSNGEYTYLAIYNNDVWMQVKKNDTGLLKAVVVASEPTNFSEFYQAGKRFKTGWSYWQQLPNNTLFTIHRTPDVLGSTTSGHITIDANSFDAPAIKMPKGGCGKWVTYKTDCLK
jgi:predicted glutamine amidotransferase